MDHSINDVMFELEDDVVDSYLSDYTSEFYEDDVKYENEFIDEEMNRLDYYVKNTPNLDSRSIYFEMIKDIPVLTKEEEIELFQKAKDGDMAAKNKIIESNLKLVVKIAKNYYIPTPAIDFDDLIQQGNMGVMRAVESYDESRGLKFSTYAYYWINQNIERYLINHNSVIRLPVHRFDQLRKIKKEIVLASENNTKTLTEKEKNDIIMNFAKENDIDCSALFSILHNQTVSFDSKVRGDDGEENTEFGNFVASEDKTPEEAVVDIMVRESLLQYMDNINLSEKEKEVIKLRCGFYEDKVYTLAEIGDIMQVTRERIRQIESKAVQKMRKYKHRLLGLDPKGKI